MLEKEGFTGVKFTSGFVWGLNKKGEVFQWAIDKKLNEFKEITNINLNLKSIKITTLPNDIIQIETGEDHLVALTKNGDVLTMGDDTYG